MFRRPDSRFVGSSFLFPDAHYRSPSSPSRSLVSRKGNMLSTNPRGRRRNCKLNESCSGIVMICSSRSPLRGSRSVAPRPSSLRSLTAHCSPAQDDQAHCHCEICHSPPTCSIASGLTTSISPLWFGLGTARSYGLLTLPISL